MTERNLFRSVVIYIMSIAVVGLSGCSVFSKKTQTETAASTAYYMCAGCHGSDKVRVNFMTPNIIGQKKGYLVSTLKDYRDEKRIEPLMNGAVAGLSDQDIDSLADYYSNARLDK